MKKSNVILALIVAITMIFAAADSMAGNNYNHYDPHNKSYERAQKGKAWQNMWKKHYVHKKTKKQWHDSKKQDGLQPYFTGIDYSTRNIYIFNNDNLELITVSQDSIQGWHWNLPLQHTAITADGKHMWVTTDATESQPPRIIRLGIKNVNWNNNTAKLKVESELEVGSAGEPSTLPDVSAVQGSTQEIATWIQAAMTQVHAPTFLPFSKFMYWTEYPTSKVHIVKNNKHKSKLKDTFVKPGWTDQTHGIFFNSSGTLGLGTGYYYDNGFVDLYKPNRLTGELTPIGQIELAATTEHGEKFIAPFTHLVDWIDERYAYTVTMQHDRTSLTPMYTDGFVGPSVWLIDTEEMTATKVIDQSMAAAQGGVFRSGSDIAVVNDKLYIAEEDSVRQENVDDARDGYISIFDITDRANPVFLKRLEPGVDLPTGYNIAHTLVKSKDNRYVNVFSWHSGWVIQIDTYDDTVSHVWGPDDGLVMPHGGFASGQIR